jgi:hypothetical protein
MLNVELISSQDLVVALDYGQFTLHTAEEDPDLGVDLIGVALDVGIAQQGGLVMVVSPHQNNFEMPLRVEVWSRAPAADLEQWEEAFEVHLDVAAYGLEFNSPTLDFTPLPIPPGSYHALITGRGFIRHGWPGSTPPGDRWRLQVWPSDGPTGPKRLRGYIEPADPELSQPIDPMLSPSSTHLDLGDEATAQRQTHAVEAALRIGRALAFAQTSGIITDSSGAANLDIVLPRPAKVLWPLFANLDITAMGGGLDGTVGAQFRLETYGRDEDAFLGPNGDVVCVWTQLAKPTHVSLTWTWVIPIEGDRSHVRRLAQDTNLSFVLSDLTTDSEHPVTRVQLSHVGLPAEWVDDMTAIWLSKFDQWFYQARPKQR